MAARRIERERDLGDIANVHHNANARTSDSSTGADFECRRNAARANIKGSFRAFLASGFQNLNDIVRINVHKHAVVNLRVSIATTTSKSTTSRSMKANIVNLQ